MNKSNNTTIDLNRIYIFTDPLAKGNKKAIFHFFAVSKNEKDGIFLYNGETQKLQYLEDSSSKIVSYALTYQTNLFGELIPCKNLHKSIISHKITDILNKDVFSVNGISHNAIDAIRSIAQEQFTSLDTYRKYENLFVCVQEREKNQNTQQTSLSNFIM